MKNPHTELVHQTLLRIGATKYCRVWKNNTGAGVPISVIKSLVFQFRGHQLVAELMKRIISFGLKDSADIEGILSNGKSLWIECKTGAGKQTKGQKNFENMIHSFKGVYFVVRPEDPILKWIIQAADS